MATREQLVYTMFISNNRPLFYLWWKENFVKHWKVSKYYGTDCLKSFLLLIMLLSTTNFVKNSHIYARNAFFPLDKNQNSLFQKPWFCAFWKKLLIFVYSRSYNTKRSNNSVFLYLKIYWNQQVFDLIRASGIWMKPKTLCYQATSSKF